MKKPYLKKNNEQGFSLIEFIVVLVIFSIMAGTSLFNFNEYRDNIEQTNIAQDIALTIRQAQVYGISGSDRTIGDVGLEGNNNQNSVDFFGTNPQDFNGNEILDITSDRSIRGVAFNVVDNEIILFEDLNQNFEYDDSNDRIIDIRKILSNDINMSACLITQSDAPADTDNCNEEVFNESDHISITFRRPYPDAYMYYQGVSYGHFYLKLVDNNFSEKQRYIEVSPVGNISIRMYE